MSNTFNLYCDESTHLENDKKPYMVLGYIKVPFNKKEEIKKEIKQILEKHDYHKELKWNNIYKGNASLYNEIIDYFFKNDNLSFRAIIIKKSTINNLAFLTTPNDFYYKMYYQLFRHKLVKTNTYNIFLDIKDTCSQEKLKMLKQYLGNFAIIRECNFVRSHQSIFVQLADILIGAINYNLRVSCKDIKVKSQAKSDIVQKIKKLSGYELNFNTKKIESKFNLFFIQLKEQSCLQI